MLKKELSDKYNNRWTTKRVPLFSRKFFKSIQRQWMLNHPWQPATVETTKIFCAFV